MSNEINFNPTLKQHQLFTAFDDKKTTEVLYGGAASGGKSYGLCALILLKCLQYPGIRVGLARNELTVLKKTTLVSLFEVINDWKIGGMVNYNQQNGELRLNNGSKIILIDLANNPADPLYTRYGGLLLTFAAIDEVGEAAIKGKQILQSRLGRWKNATHKIKPILYMTCNPTKGWLYRDYYQQWKNGTLEPHIQYIPALITDNKYMTKEYRDNLMRTLSFADKQRLVGGNWDYDDNPDALISFIDINNTFITASEIAATTNEHYISADIAFTSDKCVIIVWRGLTAINIQLVSKDKPEEKIKELAAKYNVKSHYITYDSDGVGKYLTNYLPNAKAIVNNAATINGENYENLKTQLMFKLAELINNNKVKIVLDSNSDKYKEDITEELAMIQKKNGNDGKVALIKKAEIKKLIGRSPDFLDALAYRMIFELRSNKLPSFGSVQFG